MADHAHDHDDDYNVHAHISTIKTNVIVLGALLFLTFLTVLAYNVRLGDANLGVAVFIAMIKATVVGTWFMHLKYEKKFNILFFAGSLIFVAIFLGYTMNDTAHRGRQGSLTGLRVDPGTGTRAYGTDPLLRENGEFVAMPEDEHADHADDEHADHADGEEHEEAETEADEATEPEADLEGEALEGADTEADAEGEDEADAEAVEVQPTMDPAPAAMAPAAMAPAAMAPAAMAPAAMAPAAMAPAPAE